MPFVSPAGFRGFVDAPPLDARVSEPPLSTPWPDFNGPSKARETDCAGIPVNRTDAIQLKHCKRVAVGSRAWSNATGILRKRGGWTVRRRWR